MVINKNYILAAFSVLFLILAVSFVSAFTIISFSPDYANRTIEATINITLNHSVIGYGNVTDVNITFPAGVTFTLDSNETDVTENIATFSNVTENGVVSLMWSNSTDGIMDNESLSEGLAQKSFIFNATFPSAGFNVFTINMTYNSSLSDAYESNLYTNQSTYSYTVYFAFEGYVYNETGNAQNNTNVTIYGFVEGQNGPPTETILNSVLSAETTGLFSFPEINGSYNNYKLKFVYYNETDPSRELGNNNATKTGTILPPFPFNMYYPFYGAEDSSMSLNGTTFYLEAATTLNLTATNGTGDYIEFGYEVVDQLLGFPLESNVMGNVSNIEIVVPTGRSYTVMMLRDPTQFGQNIFSCDGTNFTSGSEADAATCPSIPKSNSTLSALTEGGVTDVIINLSMSKIQVYGCVDVEGGASAGINLSEINVTNIIPRLLPWAGFVVASMKADDGSLNVTEDDGSNPQLNNTLHILGGGIYTCEIAFYNFTLFGNSEYLLEFYAKNATDESVLPGAESFAAFQNISTGTTDIYQNITLYKLAGDYNETTERNTSFITINVFNYTGDPYMKNFNVNVKVKHDVFGTLSYIIESTANGTFQIPILNNSAWAKVYVFSNDGPPIERSINISNATTTIILREVDMSTGGDKGMRTTNSTGDFVTLNSSTTNLELEFLSTRSGCGNNTPDETCIILESNASLFNPLKALVAGKVNMRMKLTTSETTLLFHNYDMLSAKSPPLFSIINPSATTSGTNSQIWEFGSFVPSEAYENVTIITPYSDSRSDSNYINDTSSITLSIPILYTEDQNNANSWLVAWNSTAGDTHENLTDELIDYNDTAFRGYITGGVICSISDANSICFVDTASNLIYMTIPHFSGSSPSVSSSDGTAGTTTSSSGGGSAAVETWSKTITLTNEDFTAGITKQVGTNERVQFEIEGKTHQVGVKAITATSVTIKVESNTSQEATLNVGDTKKFELTGDNFYDLQVTLNKIENNKADLTIKSIYEEKKEEVTPTEEKETTPAEEIIKKVKEKPVLAIIIGAIVIIVIVLVVLFFVYKKKKRY